MNGDASYFSKSYDEARAQFLAFEVPGARRESFRVPSARDQNLFVDALFRPSTEAHETLLVITSGVHGTEGFAGSALQSMFLAELMNRFPGGRNGLLMVHALNPFGMKFNRRATEGNVNLNRNFGATAALFGTANEGYDRVADFLDPRRPARSPGMTFVSAVGFVARCLLRGGFSVDTLNRAIAHGQFAHPRGIEYGGATWEPQVAWFIELLKRTMKPYRNIVLFDLHTGLGDRYELHLIAVEDPASRDQALTDRLFHPKDDSSLYKFTGTNNRGFYKTAGELNSLPARLASPEQRILALTFEYGTLGNGIRHKVDSLARVLGENQGYHCGYSSEGNRLAGQRQFAEMFAPAEEAWRANVIRRGRDVFSRVLERL